MTWMIPLLVLLVCISALVIALFIGFSDLRQRIEYLEGDGDKLPDYKHVTIVRNPDATYTNVPTILHDAEKDSK